MTHDRPFQDEAAPLSGTGLPTPGKLFESGADYYHHEIHGPALLATCGSVADLEHSTLAVAINRYLDSGPTVLHWKIRLPAFLIWETVEHEENAP